MDGSSEFNFYPTGNPTFTLNKRVKKAELPHIKKDLLTENGRSKPTISKSNLYDPYHDNREKGIKFIESWISGEQTTFLLNKKKISGIT